MVRKKRRNVERRNSGRSKTVRRKERGRGGRGKMHGIREGTQAKDDAKKILEVNTCRCCLIKKEREGVTYLKTMMKEEKQKEKEYQEKRISGIETGGDCNKS